MLQTYYFFYNRQIMGLINPVFCIMICAIKRYWEIKNRNEMFCHTLNIVCFQGSFWSYIRPGKGSGNV